MGECRAQPHGSHRLAQQQQARLSGLFRRERLALRQRRALDLLSRGLTNKEISGVLGIAEGTVKGHLAALFELLDVTNRTEAVRALVELGLVGPGD